MRYGWGLRESGHQVFKVRSQDEVSVMGMRKRVFKNEILPVKEGKVELGEIPGEYERVHMEVLPTKVINLKPW